MMARTFTSLAAMALGLAAAGSASAQDFAITGATLATGDGSEPIADGTVVVRGGQVQYAGPSAGNPAIGSIPVIDAQGQWVTPGIFAALTDMGLWDVGAVSQSNDSAARGSPFGAALDAAPAINPASQQIAVSREGGITRAAASTMPSASIFGGQGAIIDTGADPQAVVRPRAFQFITMGESGSRIAGGSRASAHALLRNALREAGQYGDDSRFVANAVRPDRRTGDDLPIDPRLLDYETQRGTDTLLTRFDAAALVPVVRGTQPLWVEVERAADIRAVLALTSEFPDLDLVLVGASEGWMVADEIAAANVPVIADGLDDLPYSFEELAATQSNIGRMVAAGVQVAINAAAMEAPRNLPQYAGNLVALSRIPGAAGLSWGQALATITSAPAAIAGYGGRYGVLAPRAAADIVIWDGDPLEVSSAPVRVFVDGVEQPQSSHQSRLRERYRDLDESDLPKAYDW